MSNSPVIEGASVADFTHEALIAPQLSELDTAGVIQELSPLLQQEARIPDLPPFYHAALNREFLVSTAMDYGMAFPHARVPA
jgi:mannitol/fructose-specific phosphotransferase system IIA component (Ntr-type)